MSTSLTRQAEQDSPTPEWSRKCATRPNSASWLCDVHKSKDRLICVAANRTTSLTATNCRSYALPTHLESVVRLGRWSSKRRLQPTKASSRRKWSDSIFWKGMLSAMIHSRSRARNWLRSKDETVRCCTVFASKLQSSSFLFFDSGREGVTIPFSLIECCFVMCCAAVEVARVV